MKLTLDQIKSIALGVSRVEENGEKISLLRFTEEQEFNYGIWSLDFHKKTFASAGVRLEFETNSTSLFLKVNVRPASSRRFCAHEIFANGELIGQLSISFDDFVTISPTELSGRFYLGNGSKKISIYFPWSFASDICELSLDDGSTLIPTKKLLKMIMFGDSITHGYDALIPSNTYASRVADLLEADAINKGIGGERFRPELALLKDNYEPDIITVAYGTNDWGGYTKEEFEKNCKGFYQNLSATYPNAKIFAISPIWRADCENPSKVGDFTYTHKYIDDVANSLDNVIHINALEFLPQDTSLFSDLFLHPNDKGFEYYANALYREIKKCI